MTEAIDSAGAIRIKDGRETVQLCWADRRCTSGSAIATPYIACCSAESQAKAVVCAATSLCGVVLIQLAVEPLCGFLEIIFVVDIDSHHEIGVGLLVETHAIPCRRILTDKLTIVVDEALSHGCSILQICPASRIALSTVAAVPVWKEIIVGANGGVPATRDSPYTIIAAEAVWPVTSHRHAVWHLEPRTMCWAAAVIERVARHSQA